MSVISETAFYRRIRRIFKPVDPGMLGFLKGCTSIVHVGGNFGQERKIYESLGVNVLWIEPIDEIYERLCSNIKSFAGQKAVKALLTDKPGQQVTLNIASNRGASSSIFPLADHKKLWPEIDYVGQVQMVTDTLDNVLADQGPVDALVMDTQGAELLILRGGEETLKHVQYVHTEASDFDAYAGGCRLSEISAFLGAREFYEIDRESFAGNPAVGHCYNITFKRMD